MNPAPIRTYAFTWFALLVLLALTCGSSFVSMGAFNLVVNVAIAAAKALLVVFVFMKIGRDEPMVWLVALAGVVWLSLLAGISATDFATRIG